jgi:uncharacterized protein YidB (DUF937 family)
MSPLLKLLLGLVAYRSLTRGKGRLAAIIGAGLGRAGGLGGLFAGGAGVALLSALQDMLGGLREKGPIAAAQVEEALGEERIQWLMKQTGLSRAALIAGLSKTRWKP